MPDSSILMFYFLPIRGKKERMDKNSRDRFFIFSCFSHKQKIHLFPYSILGEQTRHSIVHLQKRVKEMVPKEGIYKYILINILFFYMFIIDNFSQ
jgi:hypothetical protein